MPGLARTATRGHGDPGLPPAEAFGPAEIAMEADPQDGERTVICATSQRTGAVIGLARSHVDLFDLEPVFEAMRGPTTGVRIIGRQLIASAPEIVYTPPRRVIY